LENWRYRPKANDENKIKSLSSRNWEHTILDLAQIEIGQNNSRLNYKEIPGQVFSLSKSASAKQMRRAKINGHAGIDPAFISTRQKVNSGYRIKSGMTFMSEFIHWHYTKIRSTTPNFKWL
jgi:hypothetical protein